MSHLLRWVRQNQTLASRSASMLAGGQQGTSIAPESLLGSQAIKPLYQISAAPLTTTSPSLSQNGPEKMKKYTEQNTGEIKDDIKYTIKFKDLDVKKIIKDFYSLYGPLFIVCHIGVSLASLGFFYTLARFTIDITAFIPTSLLTIVSDKAARVTGAGGQFVVAYAVHKVLLPVRLLLAIGLTRTVSRIVQARRVAKTK